MHSHTHTLIYTLIHTDIHALTDCRSENMYISVYIQHTLIHMHSHTQTLVANTCRKHMFSHTHTQAIAGVTAHTDIHALTYAYTNIHTDIYALTDCRSENMYISVYIQHTLIHMHSRTQTHALSLTHTSDCRSDSTH